jgi:alanyl-tRNA synthetase
VAILRRKIVNQCLYLSNTYLFQSNSHIIALEQDAKGAYVLLDQTIFYPQGGGQPSDQGMIENDKFKVAVTHVQRVGYEIRHYIASPPNTAWVHTPVLCRLNNDRRILNARNHTAAHLLGNIIELLYPALKAVKGHSFPSEAYVEFQGSEKLDILQVRSKLHEAIKAALDVRVFEIDQEYFEEKFYKLPYMVPKSKTLRTVQIGDYLPVPCGGTHLNNTKEIGHIEVNKVKLKNNILRISYEVI